MSINYLESFESFVELEKKIRDLLDDVAISPPAKKPLTSQASASGFPLDDRVSCCIRVGTKHKQLDR